MTCEMLLQDGCRPCVEGAAVRGRFNRRSWAARDAVRRAIDQLREAPFARFPERRHGARGYTQQHVERVARHLGRQGGSSRAKRGSMCSTRRPLKRLPSRAARFGQQRPSGAVDLPYACAPVVRGASAVVVWAFVSCRIMCVCGRMSRARNASPAFRVSAFFAPDGSPTRRCESLRKERRIRDSHY